MKTETCLHHNLFIKNGQPETLDTEIRARTCPQHVRENGNLDNLDTSTRILNISTIIINNDFVNTKRYDEKK